MLNGLPNSPAESRPQLNPALFRDPARAKSNFALISGKAPRSVIQAIPPLLAEVPDPDAALNFFERLVDQTGSVLLRTFEKHPSLIHYALIIAGYSPYLGETLIQNPDLFQSFLREETLDRVHSREEFRESFARFRLRSFQTDMAQLLARFKRREYVRIMLRDVLGLASLAETTAEISALSDTLVDEALRETEVALRSRFGPMQHMDKDGKVAETPFAVLALGKLGGNELNYASDVDLIFLYGDGHSLDDAPITKREYAIRLAQQVTDILSRVTKEGFVFRIDLRLRPQGREGEPAVSLSRALHYYSHDARDWELQAMIKVRHCAGELTLAREFIRKVQDRVYATDLNFAAIETAIETRDRILDRRRLSFGSGGIDVKLDRGGIRDIEFLVQCMQRVYGGQERWLRSGGTLFSLQKLHDKQHLSGRTFHELTTAYEFLRKVEHRLQLRRGQQTHQLPCDADELRVIERSLQRPEQPFEDVGRVISERMKRVAEIYERIIHHQQAQSTALQSPSVISETEGDRPLLRRISNASAELSQTASRDDLDSHCRKNLMRFLSSASTSPERLLAVATHAAAVESELELFEYSDLLTDLLVRHPEDISVIAVVNKPETYEHSYSDPRSNIRRDYRRRLLISGTKDIGGRSIYHSVAETSAAAEDAIRSAFSISGADVGFAVLALGRLATDEFDFLSDADLLFVRDASLENPQAAKWAEDIVQILTAYTVEGSLMPVDLRLRPHGGEGELTVTPEKLKYYFETEAQAWEALTYTKLRFLAGDESVGKQAIAATEDLRNRFTADSTLGPEVLAMRQRIADSEPQTNLKTGPGGMYDIDFLIGYLAVAANVHLTGNAHERLRQLSAAGKLTSRQSDILQQASELYRAVEHSLRLVSGRAKKELPAGAGARTAVEILTRRAVPGLGDLPLSIDNCRREVRQIFWEILS